VVLYFLQNFFFKEESFFSVTFFSATFFAENKTHLFFTKKVLQKYGPSSFQVLQKIEPLFL